MSAVEIKRKPRGRTPITVVGVLPRRMAPRSLRPPICDCQNSYDTIATAGPPTAFSLSVNSRPTIGATPRVAKKCFDTPNCETRTGSVLVADGQTVDAYGYIADATSSNARVRSRQSTKFGNDGASRFC